MAIFRSSSLSNPVLRVLIGAFMISFSAVWVTIADVPASNSAFYRVFFGFLALLAASLYSGEYKQYLYRTQLLPIFFCGAAFALDLYFWHASILYIGPGLATIIGNFQVFLMAACGYLFFHERLRPRFLLALPLAVGGLFLIIGVDWSQLADNYKLGVVFGLLTAICYTAFLLLLRTIQKQRDHSRYTPLMLISLVSAGLLGATLLSSGQSFAVPSLGSAGALVCLGVFSQAIGWVLIATALPLIHASLTGLILLLQPSLSFLWDVIFFSRPTAGQEWLGVVITLAAIYMGLTGNYDNNQD